MDLSKVSTISLINELVQRGILVKYRDVSKNRGFKSMFVASGVVTDIKNTICNFKDRDYYVSLYDYEKNDTPKDMVFKLNNALPKKYCPKIGDKVYVRIYRHTPKKNNIFSLVEEDN